MSIVFYFSFMRVALPGAAEPLATPLLPQMMQRWTGLAPEPVLVMQLITQKGIKD